jgi:hypothetical protein
MLTCVLFMHFHDHDVDDVILSGVEIAQKCLESLWRKPLPTQAGWPRLHPALGRLAMAPKSHSSSHPPHSRPPRGLASGQLSTTGVSRRINVYGIALVHVAASACSSPIPMNSAYTSAKSRTPRAGAAK